MNRWAQARSYAVVSDTDAADEFRQLARGYEYDRYMTAAMMPLGQQEALIVLAAFAAELQRIPRIAHEPMMAAVRLQWWRDALAEARRTDGGGDGDGSTGGSGHRLLDTLVEVMRGHRLPIGLCEGMVDAAETELDATPFADSAETRQVLVKFDGALFELAARVLGGGGDVAREVWGFAAVAYGGARLAAQARMRARSGAQVYVPRRAPGSGLDAGRDAAQVHSREALSALDAVRSSYQQLDLATRRALLPLSTVQPLLRAVAMSSQQSDGMETQLSRFVRARTLLFAHWRGRI